MNMEITIDGKPVESIEGATILELADQNGIYIPSLCFHKELDHCPGTCSICLVQIEKDGVKRLATSCNTLAEPGVKIDTKSKRVRNARKLQAELLVADHDANCLACDSQGDCELRDVVRSCGVSEGCFLDREYLVDREIDINDSHVISRDMSKCIRCGRCIKVCQDVQGVAALTYENKGVSLKVGPKEGETLHSTGCVSCGQCTLVCPVGALSVKNDIDKAIDFISDEEITTIVQFAPATRVALGEEFDLKRGEIVTGQMVSALKAVGIDVVLDTNFAADVVIMEEGTELLQRVSSGEHLPMFTSCSPGWINFVEKHYPELLAHVSSVKSPQQCFGALAKTYLAKNMGLDSKNIRVISIMPCTAKKDERARSEHQVNGAPEVDVVLTTRELAELLKRERIDINTLEETALDNHIMGETTGAAVIFGATGGVMEAAVRTVYELVNKKPLANINITDVRGYEEKWKEASVKLNGIGDVKVAVVHGLKAAKAMLELVKKGECPYTFIEVMACPGGCIGGGGQPKHKKEYKSEIVNKRKDSIYSIDEKMVVRTSHSNKQVQKLYEDFLGEPCGEKSHHLLHTSYKDERNPEPSESIQDIWDRI